MRTWWIGLAFGFVVGVACPTSAAAAPQAASPMISVRPATNLADGQRVTVTGAGFAQSPFQLGLVECQPGTGFGACGSNFVSVTVGPSGRFTERFSVSRLIITESLSGFTTVDCAQLGACALRAIDFENGQSVDASLAFNPSSPFRANIHVDPQAQINGAGDEVIVHGTLTCVKNTIVQLSGTLTEPQPLLTYRQPLFADPHHHLRIVCHSNATSWTATVSSWPGKFAMGGAAGLFAPGRATVTLSASIPATNAPIAQTTVAVHLRGGSEPAKPVYYLALGESLAHGYAAAPGLGYTNDLLAHLRSKVPNMQLVELSCNDETTTQTINGDFCLYGSARNGTPLTQLQAAESFLHSHRGSIALITIDLGGVDLVRCSTATCVSQAEAVIAPNLAQIIGGLHQAGGNVPIVADNYFDPVLADWFNGPSGQALATASVVGIEGFNAFLASTYEHLGAPTADIQTAFRTADTVPIASQWGTIPTDVYMMCRYTDIPCPRQLIDADANAAGYDIFSKAFERVVDPLLFRHGSSFKL